MNQVKAAEIVDALLVQIAAGFAAIKATQSYSIEHVYRFHGVMYLSGIELPEGRTTYNVRVKCQAIAEMNTVRVEIIGAYSCVSVLVPAMMKPQKMADLLLQTLQMLVDNEIALYPPDLESDLKEIVQMYEHAPDAMLKAVVKYVKGRIK